MSIALPAIAYALLIIIIMEWARERKNKKKHILAISPDEFKKEAIGGQIIDCRKKEDFKKSHISGSRNFSVKDLKYSTSSIMKDQVQFVYGENYGMAKKGANALYKAGVTKIVVMKGKFQDYTGKLK